MVFLSHGVAPPANLASLHCDSSIYRYLLIVVLQIKQCLPAEHFHPRRKTAHLSLQKPRMLHQFRSWSTRLWNILQSRD